jgi:hypothetical protein
MVRQGHEVIQGSEQAHYDIKAFLVMPPRDDERMLMWSCWQACIKPSLTKSRAGDFSPPFWIKARILLKASLNR